MTRSSFLLLDANMVIQLFKSGAWQQFAANAQIQLPAPFWVRPTTSRTSTASESTST